MSDTIYKLKAFHTRKAIDLKNCKHLVQDQLKEASAVDLFFSPAEGKYVLVLNYGVLVFYKCSQEDIGEVFQQLSLLNVTLDYDEYSDDYGIRLSEGAYSIHFDHIVLPDINEAVIRIAMLNLGQSLALRYYDAVSQDLITQVRRFTAELETTGQLHLSGKSILKFVGKALNTQNHIAENLYIFDAPPDTWENEYLERVNTSLSRHFELSSRYRSIDNTFKIIKENLSTYVELYHHKENSRLEWIIIILILVEVLDTLISKFF